MTAPPPFPWTEIATALTIWGVNVAAPGPNVFYTIAIALGSGRRTALAVVPAIAIGVLAWAALAVFGAAIILRQVPWLSAVLSAVGGAILIWFAWRYARRAWGWSSGGAGARVVTARSAFLASLGVLAANPRALTTWLVLIGIFPAGSASPAAIAVMILGAAALAGAIHAVYALAFSTRPAAAAFARAGRSITAGVAVFFAVLGIMLFARAFGLPG